MGVDGEKISPFARNDNMRSKIENTKILKNRQMKQNFEIPILLNFSFHNKNLFRN